MLTVAGPPDEIKAWYSGAGASSASIAADAYAKAVEYFKKELAEKESERAWINGQTSLDDVRKTVERARDTYNDRSEHHVRARKWIDAFATTIVHYGAVISILANADPLHAGLAWGAIRFVFTGVSSYAQHAAELAKALARIGDVLPRVQIELALYQTARMSDAIAQLYAHILLFLQRAVTWYNANRARRVMKTVFRPVQLGFQETVADIELCTKNVEMIASTAGRAEIRGQSVALEEQAVRQQQIERRLSDIQTRLEQMQASSQQLGQLLDQLVQYAKTSNNPPSSIKVDVIEARVMMCTVQAPKIVQVLQSDKLPEDVLLICQSFSRRQGPWYQHDRASAMTVTHLKKWTWLPSSSVFVVQAGPRAAQRAVAMVLEVTTFLQSSRYPVFWCLSDPTKGGRTESVSDVLRSLIFQAIRQDQSIPSQDPRLGSLSSYGSQHSLAEWTDLAILVLSRVARCFILIAREDLYRRGTTDGTQSHRLHAILASIFEEVSRRGSVIKLLVVSFNYDTSLTLQNPDHVQVKATMSA